MKTTSYLHNTNCGDLIGALAGIREAYRKYGRKAVIYQELNMPGLYMQGLVHSVKDSKGVQVTMNRKMFDMLRPLLLAQDYIEDFLVYENQKVDIDLTIIREWVICTEEQPEKPHTIIPAKQFVNIPHMALPGWLMTAYPPMACDISKPWIAVPDGEQSFPEYILINRTERYLCPGIDYSFLKNYSHELLFTGTETEHTKFCKDFQLDFPRLMVDDFLELAQVLKSCRFFIGNQSFPWNLANAMGVPRLLEMYAQAPNCQPFVGEDNYGYLQQVPLEYYFELLYTKKAALNWTADCMRY